MNKGWIVLGALFLNKIRGLWPLFYCLHNLLHLGVEPTSAFFYSSAYDEKENSDGR